MRQEVVKPVQVTITAAGNHADQAAVQSVVSALRAALELPDIADTVDATITIELTEHVVTPEATTGDNPKCPEKKHQEQNAVQRPNEAGERPVPPCRRTVGQV